MQLKPGTKIQSGKYEIIRTLGQGGFGITYEAEQVALRRKVAIKEFFMKEYCERDGATSHVTLGATAGSKEIVARFRTKFIREAQMIAGLEHPHIVKIYDVFEENGTAYYVMEYLEGESLSDRVKKYGAIPEEEALKYIRQVASALSYIHGRNSLHFDVKPSNILVNKAGDAILIDFGISKHYDEAGNQTSSTPVGISKGYAPMEQYQQSEISTFTPATDIYALGATLYTLLTGKVPPSASEVNEDGLPPFPAGVSKNLQNAIEKAMSPRRKDRPQSVEAFLALLDAPVDSEETVVPSKSKPESKPVQKTPETLGEKPKSKAWLWALLACAIVAAIITAIVLGGWNEKLENNNPTTGTINGHDWVDLGLSVKWATCNVGASSPSDFGSYFAWGETKPKDNYLWSTLQYCAGDFDDAFFDNYTFEKYGSVDNKMTLDMSDDAARQNWGGSWRMPTDVEIDELIETCRWTWTKQDGKNGYKITSKTNGNSIFLPAAGCRYGDSVDFAGTLGLYWSSSLIPDHPESVWDINFGSDGVVRINYGRYNGLSVRPVTE